MKFTVIAVGKITISYCKEGIQEYVKRLRPYANLEIIEVGEEKRGDRPSETDRFAMVDAEGEKVLKRIKSGAFVVLLDVHGKAMSSEVLATKIAELGLQGTSEMVFVVGGTYGVSMALRQRANVLLSISPMTFTHQMARLILLEQLYRACKINAKEPYHW